MGNRSSSTYNVQNEEKKKISSKQSVKKRPSTRRDVGNAHHEVMKEEVKKHIQETTKQNEIVVPNVIAAVPNDIKLEKAEKEIVTTNESIQTNLVEKAVHEERKETVQSNHITEQTKEIISVEESQDVVDEKIEVSNVNNQPEDPPKIHSFKIDITEKNANNLEFKELPIEENIQKASLEEIVTKKQEAASAKVNVEQEDVNNTETQNNSTESAQARDNITNEEILDEIINLQTEDKNNENVQESNEIKFESYSFGIESNQEAEENEISKVEDLDKIEVCKGEEAHVKRIDLTDSQNKREIGTESSLTDVNTNDVKFDVEVYTYKEENEEKIIEIEDNITSTTSNKVLQDKLVDIQLKNERDENEKEVTENKHITINTTSAKVLEDNSVDTDLKEEPKGNEKEEVSEIEDSTTISRKPVEDKSEHTQLKNESKGNIEDLTQKEELKEDSANTKEGRNEVSKEVEPTATKSSISVEVGEKPFELPLSNHADTTAPIEQKQLDPLSTIRTLEEEIKIYKEQVVLFAGTTKDKQYIHLKEMLVRCMIKLDDIIVGESDELRNERKRVIKFAQDGLDTLERNVVKTNAGSDDDDDDDDGDSGTEKK